MTKKLLFVCIGNICRSPTAHAVMRHKVKADQLEDKIHIDSAGTHAYHTGETPDPRSCQTAQQRGVGTDDIHARTIQADDYYSFDIILAMDADNLNLIQQGAPKDATAKIQLFLQSANNQGLTKTSEVPDPYYGGAQGFDLVFDLVELGCDALLNEILAA